MRKIISTIVLLTMFGFQCIAQSTKPGNFSIGVDGAIPIRTERQIFDAAVGGSVQYQHRIFNRLYGGLSGGFESFSTIKKLVSVNVPANYNYIPIKAELRFYPIWGIYAVASAGEVIYTQHGGGHAFDVSPGLGWSAKKGFEISFRYEEWKQTPENHIPTQFGQSGPFAVKNTFGQLAIRLAERF